MSPANELDFHAIVERFHGFQNPTSEAKLDRLIESCGVADGRRVLDVGCGKAWLLRRMSARHAIDGVGVELRAAFVDEARRELEREPGRGAIALQCMPARKFAAPPRSFDVALCIGASFALGTFEDLIAWLRPFAKSGGVLAVGDIYARATPLPPESAAHFAGGAQRSLADTAELLNTNGLRLCGVIDSSLDDWDRYESLRWRAGDAWLREHPDHPQREAFRAQLEADKRQYLRFDRAALGWALFVARVE